MENLCMAYSHVARILSQRGHLVYSWCTLDNVNTLYYIIRYTILVHILQITGSNRGELVYTKYELFYYTWTTHPSQLNNSPQVWRKENLLWFLGMYQESRSTSPQISVSRVWFIVSSHSFRSLDYWVFLQRPRATKLYYYRKSSAAQ